MEAVVDTCSTVLHYNQMLKFRRIYGQKQVTDRENEIKKRLIRYFNHWYLHKIFIHVLTCSQCLDFNFNRIMT